MKRELAVEHLIIIFGGSGHVESLIKKDNDSYLSVISNTPAKNIRDRGVYVKEVLINSPKRANLGHGFMFSEPA